ncbi:MAG: Histidine-tRNA ligase [Candidatus Daviesbacteria bacterium GW2011_GWB1_41_5]|uniref:Histidine--tRNA ligase n=1 Tax=Candidatus Daviesbacteria bacterium GW2011_GWB1_41_5 TaxID=1618429 RepID=A0A0G0WKK2_9BACT|nr:MAG: Histidine-tRNA ligase [Candidatus Daviesbacteria bacterium GW2011_GWB1_41_5]
MNKQIVQPVKGTRDFYPEQMAFRNYLYGKIREFAEKFGYQEVDGPILEYFDLYANKTSQEILEGQTFTISARGEQTIILRPEFTPTYARMVAQRSQELLKPIRWFSFGRTFRYEQPQKGRTREFFQLEVNLLGPETPEADAEIIAIATQYLKALGLTSSEVVIKVNDREFMQTRLKEIGTSEKQVCPVLRLIDRKEKITTDEFRLSLLGVGLSKEVVEKVEEILTEKDYSKSPWLTQVFETLKQYPGILDFIEFDPSIVRGFDYYTRTVFEAWDKSGKFGRSLFGGGRFDNLTAQIGGEKVPGVGFASGDIPIQVILEQYKKLPDLKPKTAQVLVTVFNTDLEGKSIEVASFLRRSLSRAESRDSNGINCELWVEPGTKLDKQLKYADQKGIPYVVIIGPDEAKSNKITLKNLKEKTQQTMLIDEILSKLI